ncbi:lactadherin-like [Oculina patagonica]
MEKSSRMIALLILYLAVLQQLCPILAVFNVTGVEKFIVTRRGMYDTDLFRVVYKTGYKCTVAKVCGSTSFEDTVACGCTCNNLYPSFLPELGECGNTATVKASLFGSCSNPLGMESGNIDNSQLTSLTHKSDWYPYEGRLNNSDKAWCSAKNHDGEYFQIDLIKVRRVSAIATQGVKDRSKINYVTTFQIKYSYDGASWLSYEDKNGDVFK